VARTKRKDLHRVEQGTPWRRSCKVCVGRADFRRHLANEPRRTGRQGQARRFRGRPRFGRKRQGPKVAGSSNPAPARLDHPQLSGLPPSCSKSVPYSPTWAGARNRHTPLPSKRSRTVDSPEADSPPGPPHHPSHHHQILPAPPAPALLPAPSAGHPDGGRRVPVVVGLRPALQVSGRQPGADERVQCMTDTSACRNPSVGSSRAHSSPRRRPLY
jgi:hypothetical protein